ncbi:MAG: hypothetical protein C0619_06780 [Desulfuromonas sp.]|nr:MAG: hypothetical protein C0619_06780 [Desulfuromonas sp.]
MPACIDFNYLDYLRSFLTTGPGVQLTFLTYGYEMPLSANTLKFIFCSFMLLLLLSACQVATTHLPEEFQNDNSALPAIAGMQTTIDDIAGSGGNLGRLAALQKQIETRGLAPYLSSQHIDWYGLQKNLIIEIPGKSSQIIYFVAHYDKTDANPLTFVSLMLNGFLDTLISPIFLSDGALDNATGVSVLLELAQQRSRLENYYTYRFLFVGSEETGLRGSRVHVARLADAEKASIQFAINVDTVGVKGAENCITDGVSDPQLSYQAIAAAKKLGYTLESDPSPTYSTSDYLPFQELSFASDFAYGLQLNFVGGILPQRSWFADPGSVPVLNFSSCGIMQSSADFITSFLLPFGQLHSFRDSAELVDLGELYELYLILDGMLGRIEKDGVNKDPFYRIVKHDGISSIQPVSAN